MSLSDPVSQRLPSFILRVFNVLALVLSIVGIIAQAKGVLCESGSWSWRSAKAYISVIDFVSIS